MSYEFQSERFSGPLQTLLALIEERKLDITDFALAEITADFLRYAESLRAVEPRVIAEFIAVAARLMLIKSKRLIPELELTEEENESVRDLEERLRRYRAFRDAERNLGRLFTNGGHRYAPEASPYLRSSVFHPPSALTTSCLEGAFSRLVSSRNSVRREEAAYEAVNLERRIEELLARIRTAGSHFGEVSAGQSRREVVILFLALLHLLKDNRVRIAQEESFSAILIHHHAHTLRPR